MSSSIKKLAGQTLWYGGSTIAARFINYLLTPFLTYSLADQMDDYGKIGVIYSLIPLFNVLFTYGFETAFFRFSGAERGGNREVYSTAFLSLLFSTLVFTLGLWWCKDSLALVIGLQQFPQMISLMIIIIGLDTLAAIPFARLRQENKPKKFAFAKVIGILINILLTWFFIGYCPKLYASDPNSLLLYFYDPAVNPVTWVLIANLVQAGITLMLLLPEILQVRFRFDRGLWKQMLIYSSPLIIAGLGGMINETFDRLMLLWWLPGSIETRQSQIGIYNACAKLPILITLFIQAFRMSAEPFFFRQTAGADAKKTYARVMKFFVMLLSVMFLVVALLLPLWRHLIAPSYWAGLRIVPILLMANIFLGIYYNLSIWYKLGNKTIYGAWITILGTLITLGINYVFIPAYGYAASAWATLCCYGFMMFISWYWGKKNYPIPYATKKLLSYLGIALALYFIHAGATQLYANAYFNYALALIFILLFCRFLTVVEFKEFVRLPFIGKYFDQPNFRPRA